MVASLSDPSQNAGDAEGDVYISLQGLIGSAFDDVLRGDDETNDIHGLGGADFLNGLAGTDGLEACRLPMARLSKRSSSRMLQGWSPAITFSNSF